VIGMTLIVVGGAILAWPGALQGESHAGGMLMIAGACLCWALDNNLTRQVSGTDALFLAGSKGLIAGATNVALAFVVGAHLPSLTVTGTAMAVGLFGYGASLVLFVTALRELGSARTGAYFSTAPFLGAAIAVIALHEPASTGLWVSALLMAVGVVLHLTEHHQHEHTHVAQSHAHVHTHDVHHQHVHPFAWDGTEPHSHPHEHQPVTHQHAHFPDLHHRHDHQG